MDVACWTVQVQMYEIRGINTEEAEALRAVLEYFLSDCNEKQYARCIAYADWDYKKMFNFISTLAAKLPEELS